MVDPTVPAVATALMFALVACTSAPVAAPTPTDDLSTLVAECDGVGVPGAVRDRPSCLAAARLMQEQGRPFEEWKDPLRYACSKIAPACVELGIHYLAGKVTPVDVDQAIEHFSSGCVKRDTGACGWWHVLRLRKAPKPEWRFSDAKQMHLDCQRSTAPGWVCTNFGVALSCGLFGYNDLPGGRRVLSRACKRGDDRACELWMKMRADQSLTPTCELIGGDPKHPVELGLDLTPMAWPAEKGSPFE